MRKIILWLIVSILLVSNTYSFQCDQTFYWKLRYWYQYTFYDDFKNTWNPKWINSVEVNYIEQHDYNWSSSFPTFSWTSWIIDKWYILNDWDEGRVIQADTTYPILYHPATRNQNNFVIQYKAKYYEQVWWVWNMSNPKYHTECKYYEVTWCWDWVLDTEYWEVCDPNDTSRIWWWTGWCSNTCQPIEVPVVSTCDNLTATPSSWNFPLNVSVSCSWTNASSYRVNCWNWQTISANAWTCVYSTQWTYVPTCYVNTNITSASCQKTINVNWDDTSTSTSTSTSSSGWSSSSSSGWSSSSWWSSSSGWSSSGWSSSSGGSSSWWSSSWWVPTYCWDWSVQRPNSDPILEECDFWTLSSCVWDTTYDPSWNPTCWPNWCWMPGTSNACKIGWDFSLPADWQFIFWPNDSVIIWAGMNPFESYNLPKPSIINNTSFDYYFDELCITKTIWTSLSWANEQCESLWLIWKDGWNYRFSSYPNFVWNTSSLASWTYWDNILVTTIKHNWVLHDSAYFRWSLNVRVSKPSISTTGWGTSYISNTDNISNVSSTVSSSYSDSNKNFVWVWVSTWNISSYSDEVRDSTSVSVVSDDWNKYNQSVIGVSNTEWVALTTSDNLTDFQSYNWIASAFVIKNTNFKVYENTFTWLSWPRTYVIENWNLIIEWDINYSDNIAFVVKWWDIKISNNIVRINWTYITIPKSWIGWNIESIWWTTTNVLNVYWSLYWKIERLTSDRTFIKQNSSWQLDVWTIVSFGSSVFRSPAPLTSTFINEYMEATKVAK